MKTLKYVVMALGVVCLITSCDSMEDVHKKYLEGSDIIYRAKAKEVVGYSGFNRAKLTWTLEYPTQVTKCQIREGDVVLAEIPVEYKDRVELEYLLTDQPEKTHTYSVYSLDADGNSSIKTDVIIDVYGERYISTLRTGRSIEAVFRQVGHSTTVLVRLSVNASSKVVGTYLYYKSVSGEELKLRVDAGVNEVVLENVASDSYFNLSDVWMPYDTAIDEVSSAARECAADDIPTPLARTFTMIYKKDATTIVANLSFANTGAGVSRSIVSYGGKEVFVEPATNQVTLTDVPAGADISIVTIITVDGMEYGTTVPAISANELVTKIDMADWEIIKFSSRQENEGPVNGAIDDDLNTIWHTLYSPDKPEYPHYIIVDMKEVATVCAVAVARRNGNANFASKMRLEVSADNVNWETAGEFAPSNTIDGLQLFKLTNPLNGRYVKLTALISSTGVHYFCLSEMNLYR